MHKLETETAFLVENTCSAIETFCWTALTKLRFEPWSPVSQNNPSVRAMTLGREPVPLLAVHPNVFIPLLQVPR